MDIIATIGPWMLTREKIELLVSAGATIFRINGAHTEPAAAASIIEEVRRFSGGQARIMIDLPTNKIRTVNIEDPIVFSPGETFALHPYQFNYPNLYEIARVGDEVIVNDGMNHLFVAKVDGDVIEFRADSAGQLGNKRGLIFVREIHTRDFPYFFDKDLELIKVANDTDLDLVGLSYLRYPSDKEEAHRRIKNVDSLVYKIETRTAFAEYERLICPGEKILLDRGDLAGEIGLVNVPQAQDRIVRFAHRQRVEVYLATQFLSSMEHAPVPHIAEVCALYDTIKLGVSGIQLSEETAVGKFPLKAIKWIRDIEKLVSEEGRPNALN